MFYRGSERLLGVCGLVTVGLFACGDPGGSNVELATATSEPGTTADVPMVGASDSPSTDVSGTGVGGTDEPTTGGPGEETTDSIMGCGDGVVDLDEQCDDGLAGNADSRFCTADCTLNVCGDGKLFVDWELCDEGPANSDEYGSLCGSQCTPGARCGDGVLQAAFETCDLGPDNGGTRGDAQEILCDASCRAQRLRGFVTMDAFSGDLGGLFGADLKCSGAAAAAGLSEPERFHALLSTGDVDAKDRFDAVAAALPYVHVTGKKFADNFTALLMEGPFGEGMAITETGASLYEQSVVTNTAPGGVRYSPDQHCQGWTSADAVHKARVGLNAMPVDSPDSAAWKSEQWWLGVLSYHCDKDDFHLYCLEI